MQKLFIDYTPEEDILLTPEQERHLIKSLRMKTGDIITVCDANGTDYGCILENIETPAKLKICYKQVSNSEPSISVTLYQGLPKGDKMEDIIQKSVELGVFRIQPVLTIRCVSRPDEKSMKKKLVRWNKIALEAAQQSGRSIVPEVLPLISFEQGVKQCRDNCKLFFYEGGGSPIKTLVSGDEISAAIFIGPEGGFDEQEVNLAKECGFQTATLGPRILRTQTAPAAVLSVLMMLSDNMN